MGRVTQEAVLAKLSEQESSGEPVTQGWQARVEAIVAELEAIEDGAVRGNESGWIDDVEGD